VGRTDDMLKIRGVNVFPSQIESLIYEVEGGGPPYQILIDRKAAMDQVTVLVEAAETAESSFDQERRKSGVAETIRKRLAHELGITVDVKLVGKNSIDRSEGKARRVIDNRKL